MAFNKTTNTTEDTGAKLLPELRQALHREMKRYPTYSDFLFAVKATSKDGTTVYKYNNDLMEEYESRYLKPHVKQINDLFIFEAKAKFRSKKQVASNKYELVDTGYFCPRMFWDFVRDEIRASYTYSNNSHTPVPQEVLDTMRNSLMNQMVN